MKCKICNSGNYSSYEVKEMMFGFRDKFLYLECLECGCLQIAQIPADMSKYYPKKYFSFSRTIPEINNQKSKLKKFIKKHGDNFVLFKKAYSAE